MKQIIYLSIFKPEQNQTSVQQVLPLQLWFIPLLGAKLRYLYFSWWADQVLTKSDTITQLTANWSILDLASLPQQRISFSWKVNHGFNRNQSFLIILYSWLLFNVTVYSTNMKNASNKNTGNLSLKNRANQNANTLDIFSQFRSY